MANTIISIIFRLINFGALIGLAWYIFSKKMLENIRTKIKEKKMEIDNLKMNKQNLYVKQQVIRQEINNQNIYAQQIVTKLKRWRTQVALQQKYEEHAVQQYAITLQKRINKQQEIYHMRQEQKALIPLAIQEATVRIKKIYEKADMKEKYLNAIFHSMDKE